MKILIIFSIIFLLSCSVEKRYHRVGWNFQYHTINTSLKIKKSKNSTHEFSENKTLTSNFLDTISSEKKDVIHLTKNVFKKNEKDIAQLIAGTGAADSLIHFIAPKKKKLNLKRSFLSKESESLTNFRKTNKYSNAIADLKQPTYFEGSSALWSAFIITGIIGLIVLLIAAIVQSALFFIISQVIFFIAGILLVLAIFSFLICLITFGMIC